MIEIETTIRGGLPVIARGRHCRGYAGTRWQPPEPEGVEDIEIFWLTRPFEKMRPCSIDPTEAEIDRIEREMLDRTYD